MAAVRIQARAGFLSGFKFIFMQQDSRQEGPIPANSRFHRMNGAAALFIEDTAFPGFVFHRQTQGRCFQKVISKLLHRNL